MGSHKWMIAGLGMVAALQLAACEQDASAPNRKYRDDNFNAEKRELEKPRREVPTGTGSEFPGQSQAPAAEPRRVAQQNNARVLTLDNVSRDDGHVKHWKDNPDCRWISWCGTPEKKDMTVPLTDGQAIPDYWGTEKPLLGYRHRPWPYIQGNYASGAVKHNPVYLVDLDARRENGEGPYETTTCDYLVAAADIPWAPINLAITPVLWFIDPPLKEVTTDHPDPNPIYKGHLPKAGPIDPAPMPGKIEWTYPWMNPDNDLVRPGYPGTRPATTQPAK